jgi:hypothetical protein
VQKVGGQGKVGWEKKGVTDWVVDAEGMLVAG